MFQDLQSLKFHWFSNGRVWDSEVINFKKTEFWRLNSRNGNWTFNAPTRHNFRRRIVWRFQWIINLQPTDIAKWSLKDYQQNQIPEGENYHCRQSWLTNICTIWTSNFKSNCVDLLLKIFDIARIQTLSFFNPILQSFTFSTDSPNLKVFIDMFAKCSSFHMQIIEHNKIVLSANC